MSSTRVPPGQMPIVFERFAAFDRDQSGGLSPQEIEQMSRDDIPSLFFYGVNPGEDGGGADRIRLAEASEILGRLRPETRTHVLRSLVNLTSSSPALRSDYVRLLTDRNFAGTVEDLGRDYQSDDPDGLKGHLILKGLPQQAREQILGALDVRFPEYGRQIRGWDRAQPPHTSPVSNAVPFMPPTHANPGEALGQLTDGKDIRVYGFGEVHVTPQTDGFPAASSLEHFAQEIVPYLVREGGVSVIALENLFSDTADEVDFYLEYGVIDPRWTPRLNFIINYAPDSRGVLSILDTVRELRREGYYVELAGTNVDFHSYGNFLRGSVNPDQMMERINENCQSVVAEAMSENRRIALYNGARHNDVSPPRGVEDLSFVRRLNLNPQMFLEIDLIVPEYYSFVGDPDDPLVFLAPRSGVLLQGRDNSHNLVFPRTPENSSPR